MPDTFEDAARRCKHAYYRRSSALTLFNLFPLTPLPARSELSRRLFTDRTQSDLAACSRFRTLSSVYTVVQCLPQCAPVTRASPQRRTLAAACGNSALPLLPRLSNKLCTTVFRSPWKRTARACQRRPSHHQHRAQLHEQILLRVRVFVCVFVECALYQTHDAEEALASANTK